MGELTVAEVLERAADLIEPEGRWVKGELAKYNPDGFVCGCAMGAILDVPSDAIWDALAFIEAGLPQTRPGGLRPIAAWNDAPERTQAEVVAKLREAAQLARTQDNGSL